MAAEAFAAWVDKLADAQENFDVDIVIFFVLVFAFVFLLFFFGVLLRFVLLNVFDGLLRFLVFLVLFFFA